MRALRLAALLLLHAAAAHAQFFKVYGWETPQQGWVEPTLWNTWVAKSDAEYTHFGGGGTREGLWAHSLELEYGVTDRLSVAAYADFENAPHGGTFRYTGVRVEARYRLFERFQMLFDPALYLEYEAPRASYGEPEEMEARLILQHDFEDVRLLLNPLVRKVTSGEEVKEGIEGGIAAGLYYRRFFALQPGVEYYANIGPLRDPLPGREQQHRIFPTLTVQFKKRWNWNLGVGFGLTHASDEVTFKSILSYEFQTVRPSKQM